MTGDIAAEVVRFLELERARGLHAKTVPIYELAVAEVLGVAAARGKNDLRELTADDLVAYLQHLVAQGFAERTIRGRLDRLKRLFAYLQRSGWLLVDPAATVRRRYVPGRSRGWLSEEEAERLLQAPPPRSGADGLAQVRHQAILEVLYSTGVRSGELLALELDDLDLADGYVTVRESKNGDGRVLPLGRHAVQWLLRYLREVRPRHVERQRGGGRQERTRAVTRGRNRYITPWVFVSTSGRRLRPSLVNRALAQAAQRAGLDKAVTAHVLRHTFAMHLLRNGASTRHIQAMLGHRSLQATQRYTRLLQLELREVHRRAHPRNTWPL